MTTRSKRLEENAASRNLQEEVEYLASVLWAGRDDHTAALLREGIKAMQERDRLREMLDPTEQSDEPFDDSDGVDDLDMPGAPDPYADEPGPDPWHNAEHIMGEPVCSGACVSYVSGPGGLAACEAIGQHVRDGSTCRAYRLARDKAIAEQYRTAREDEKAREDTEAAMEKRALIDFTSAMDAVRGKLTSALGLSDMTPWQDLVPAVAKLATDLANVKAESANVFLAVNVVREHLWKIRDDAARALGEDVPDWTTGDEHTAAKYVERLIERLEEREAERSRMVGTINRLEEDVRVLHEGDETEAGTWKLHYIGLCQEIGIPRSVYGDVKAPKVDEIARYMGQVYTPLTKLCERVEKMEQRIRTIDPLHDISQPIEHLPDGGMVAICSKCNARYPIMTAFCPDCGENNRLNPKPASEKP